MQKKSMKIFKNILILSSICLVLGACRTTRQVIQTKESLKENKTVKNTSYQDTILYTQKSSVNLQIPITSLGIDKKCLNTISTPFKSNLNQVFKQRNGNATAIAKVVDNQLIITAECDSIALRAKIKKEFEAYYTNNQNVSNSEEKEKTTTNYWLWGSLIAIAFIAGFITSKIY